MTSLKQHFLKKISPVFFSEISLTEVKLMQGKVLTISRRYLMPYLSYRENPAGGRICPPPPSGARVKDEH